MHITKMKFDSAGNLWVIGQYYYHSITVGTFSLPLYGIGNFFVAKLSPERVWVAAKGFNGMSGGGYYSGIDVTPDGYVYIVSSFYPSVTLDNFTLLGDVSNTYLAKFDSLLTCVWVNQPNANGYYAEYVNVGCDSNGNIYVPGNFMSHCTFSGTNQIDLYSTLNYPFHDPFVARFNPLGECIWAEKTGTGDQGVFRSDVDNNGNSYLSCDIVGVFCMSTGDSRLDTVTKMAKIDGNGIWQWIKPFEDPFFCWLPYIAADNEGSCYIAGRLYHTAFLGISFLPTTDINYNQFIAKASPTGDWLWGIQTYSLDWDTEISGITALESGNCIVIGNYNNEGVDFVGMTIPSASQNSVFIAKAGTAPVENSDTIAPVPTTSISLYPNPFSDKVNIAFDLDKAQPVSLSIYNVKGQLVKSIPQQLQQKGKNNIVWDGISNHGTQAQTGVYLLKLRTNNGNSTKLIVRK